MCDGCCLVSVKRPRITKTYFQLSIATRLKVVEGVGDSTRVKRQKYRMMRRHNFWMENDGDGTGGDPNLFQIGFDNGGTATPNFTTITNTGLGGSPLLMSDPTGS